LYSRKLEILETATFVDGRTVGHLIRAVIEGLAERLHDEVAVQLAIQARDERSRASKPTVVGFPTRRVSNG
jgi:hypothetical protein